MHPEISTTLRPGYLFVRGFLGALIVLLLVFSAEGIQAHDARPVFVQVGEMLEGRYEVQWKVPVSVPAMAVPRPLMPDSCRSTGNAVRGQTGDAYTFRQRYHCPDGLSGGIIELAYPNNNPGLSTLIRLTLLNGEVHSGILKPGDNQWRAPERENAVKIAVDYTVLGMEHIFAGLDHLLFVACLVFIAATLRRIVLTITGFTVAHSLTLALSALDLIRLPAPPVEAAIALSIAFLAHEIALGRKDSWTWRFPLLVSTTFGLLHGFGFASVLRDIGLPQTELATGLLFFNVGVELGQVAFIVLLLTVAALAGWVFAMDRRDLLADRRVVMLSSYSIGIVACFWLVQRLAGFSA